jgi:hypothetical protein
MKRMSLFLLAALAAAAPATLMAEDIDMEAYLQVSMLIDQNLMRNAPLIAQEAADLTVGQRMMLVNQYEKNAGLPFAVNFLVGLGIGSYIQGDVTGGTTALAGELISAVVMYSGIYGYNDATAGFGAVSYIGFRIWSWFRPFGYTRKYNRTLQSALQVADVELVPQLRFGDVDDPRPSLAVAVRY